MLELRDIFKTYNNQPLLRGISFSVDEGETVCLLGASGSGKSTLLRMIAGLENPERGQIFFNGVDLAQTPTHLRDFGLVFQDYGLFPHLNIFDNIAFGLKMKNIPAPEISLRVAALLEQVNLRGFEKRKVTDLSGGEQQMLATARGLMLNPHILMLDEPSMGLSPVLVELIFDIIKQMNEKGTTILLVEQNALMALSIAHRGYVLQTGEIVLSDTAANLKKNEMVKKAYLGVD